MIDEKNEVLRSLCEGNITFSEAANLLGVSKEEVEEMLESFVWVPSVERVAELCEIERETLSSIEYKNRTVISKMSDYSAYRYNQMRNVMANTNFSMSVDASIRSSTPYNQESVVINIREDDGVPYIQ